MTRDEAFEVAAGHAMGCTSAEEGATVEELAGRDPGFAAVLHRYRATVAGLDLLMSRSLIPPGDAVLERIVQSLD